VAMRFLCGWWARPMTSFSCRSCNQRSKVRKRHDTTRHDTTRHDTTRHDTRTTARTLENESECCVPSECSQDCPCWR
jgi:hypothetical protein